MTGTTDDPDLRPDPDTASGRPDHKEHDHRKDVPMQRVAQIIRVRPEHIEAYKEVHAAVWPDVLAMIASCNIKNYSIFLREPENLLFSYFEYHGTDFAADQARMAADPATREWWKITEPQQERLDTASPGQWWAPVPEVFHVD